MRTTEPTTITQGEQIEWTRYFRDHPATEWTLEYRYRGPSQGFDITATADGANYAVTIEAADTADIATGDWQWQAWVTSIADADDTEMIHAGNLTVLQGFGTNTDQIDLRTNAQIQLDALDVALLASGDVLKYEIITPSGSRKVERGTRSEILALRKFWANKVARERAAARLKVGKPFGLQVKARLHDA